MHVLYTQTKKVFFQLRPGSLKRVKRCCSPLWELQKNQRRGKRHAGCYCCFRILHKQERSDQRRDFAHNMRGFHLRLPVSVTSSSGRFWENRYRGTNQPPQEGRRASKTPHLQREDLSLRWRPCGAPPSL